jgi:hypothetical protein
VNAVSAVTDLLRWARFRRGTGDGLLPDGYSRNQAVRWRTTSVWSSARSGRFRTTRHGRARRPDLPAAAIGFLPGDEYIVTGGGLAGRRGYFSRTPDGAITGVDLAGRLFTRAAGFTRTGDQLRG